MEIQDIQKSWVIECLELQFQYLFVFFFDLYNLTCCLDSYITWYNDCTQYFFFEFCDCLKTLLIFSNFFKFTLKEQRKEQRSPIFFKLFFSQSVETYIWMEFCLHKYIVIWILSCFASWNFCLRKSKVSWFILIKHNNFLPVLYWKIYLN
jgi:hypothetical protein